MLDLNLNLNLNLNLDLNLNLNLNPNPNVNVDENVNMNVNRKFLEFFFEVLRVVVISWFPGRFISGLSRDLSEAYQSSSG